MKRTLRDAFTLAAFILAITSSASSQGAAKASGAWLMFVGTYTNSPRQPSKGIYGYRYEAPGKFTPLGVVAETSNPSFLVVDRNQKFVYAANEDSIYQGKPAGSISAFAIDA